MLSEGISPAILDLTPASIVSARALSPLKKVKAKGPQLIRKRLHWVAIKVRACE